MHDQAEDTQESFKTEALYQVKHKLTNHMNQRESPFPVQKDAGDGGEGAEECRWDCSRPVLHTFVLCLPLIQSFAEA